MSFGRKGLAPGQAAPRPGGFGQAGATRGEPVGQGSPSAGGITLEKTPDVDDIAAKREAFIAAERARRAEEEGYGATSQADPLADLRNGARPARPIGGEQGGSSRGLTQEEEERIRATARGMAHGGRSQPGEEYHGNFGGSNPGGASGHAGRSGRAGASAGSGEGPKLVFGDPQKRTLVLAYVMWWFAAPAGLHRFYCGHGESAIYQIALFVGSIVTMFIFPPLGFAGLAFWTLWILADAFLMPGMMKRFKAAHDWDPGVFG